MAAGVTRGSAALPPPAFLQKPWCPWECSLKAANLGQIRWFIFGRNWDPRRLSYLLKLHSHLAVQQRRRLGPSATHLILCHFSQWKCHGTWLKGFHFLIFKEKYKNQAGSYVMWPKLVWIQPPHDQGSTIAQALCHQVLGLCSLSYCKALLPVGGAGRGMCWEYGKEQATSWNSLLTIKWR